MGLARRMGTVSKEGGIKDATVDRLSEVMIAKLITEEMDLTEEVGHSLQVAFQLSTLSKAACEMSGTKTSEGGLGSMIDRRKTLFLILNDVIGLHHIPKKLKNIREKMIKNIETRIQYLVESSQQRAKDRIKLISENTSVISPPFDPESSGASEARKYAGVVLLNKSIGIDIVRELNKIAEGKVTFPSLDTLTKTPYIVETLEKAEGFMKEALAIAGY